MATVNKINWIAPTDSSIGSVLVYRAADVSADAVGSRSIIQTLPVGSISYTDTSGNPHSVYRIQFWDGTGSGPLSDPVIVDSRFSEFLADIDEVKRVARIQDNHDIGSAEIFDAIKDASWEAYTLYGDPVKRTVLHIDSSGSQEYDFTGDMGQVYQIRKISSGVVEGPLVSGSDYEVDFNNGIIQFSSGFIGSEQGEDVWIEWVPRSMNVLVKNLAGMRLIEGVNIVEGEGVESVEAKRLQNQIDAIMEAMRPKGAFTARRIVREAVKQTNEEGMWADFIGQRINRKSLKFSN